MKVVGRLFEPGDQVVPLLEVDGGLLLNLGLGRLGLLPRQRLGHHVVSAP
jgi:hypothetical protein